MIHWKRRRGPLLGGSCMSRFVVLGCGMTVSLMSYSTFLQGVALLCARCPLLPQDRRCPSPSRSLRSFAAPFRLLPFILHVSHSQNSTTFLKNLPSQSSTLHCRPFSWDNRGVLNNFHVLEHQPATYRPPTVLSLSPPP